MDYQIRTISREEMEIPIEWAAAEGWNPGLHDADSFYAADPQGFFIGFLNGEPISSISTVAYGPSFGFLGFYIVKPEYRGQGYGIQIWNEALKHLPTQNVGLDGVVAQQENYKKSGFKFAYRNIRFEGVGIKDIQPGKDVLPLTRIPFEQLIAYDSRIFPAGRPAFIKPWIRQPDSMTVGVVEHGNLQGYGAVRKCRKGYKVGPLFADGGEAAEAIFQNLLGYAGEGVPVFLDVPEINPGALSIAECYAMTPLFETARMYTKEQPDVPHHKVFGVTTFELG